MREKRWPFVRDYDGGFRTCKRMEMGVCSLQKTPVGQHMKCINGTSKPAWHCRIAEREEEVEQMASRTPKLIFSTQIYSALVPLIQ